MKTHAFGRSPRMPETGRDCAKRRQIKARFAEPRHPLRRYALAASVAALCTLAAGAAQVTSTWSSATSGSWNVNTNWTSAPPPNFFPNNGNNGMTYDAVISATGPAYTVTLNTGITIENLQLTSTNATIDHTAGTFTANAGMAISAGTYQLNGGTISNTVINQSGTGALTFANNSGNRLTGVTVNGALTLSGTQSRTKIEGGTTFTTAHLSGNQAELGFAPGSTLTGTILFESGNFGNRYVGMSGSTGTLTIDAAGVIRTDTTFGHNAFIGANNLLAGGAMTLVNQGLISSQTSGRTVSVVPASFTNQNVVEAINGGLLDISASNWTSAPGATLRALNGSTLTLNGAWSNSGALTVDSSTLNLGGTFTTAGLNLAGFTRTGGAVNVTGTLNNAANTLTLNAGTGSWTLSGGTISGGTLATTSGQTLGIANVSANLLTGVTVNGELTLSATQARTKIEGGTTFTTAHLSGNQAELGFAPGSTLTGTILFESGNSGNRYVGMNGSTGMLTIGAAGVIRTDTTFGHNAFIGLNNLLAGGAMTLVNQGLISSQTSGRTVSVVPASFTNQNVVEATNGGLLDISGTNWTSAPGATLRALNGSTLTLNGAWSNSGALTVDSSTLNLGGTFTTAGLNLAGFTRTGGSVNVTGTLNNAASTLTLNNATGSWTLSGGTISGGTLATTSGQTLAIANVSANLLTGVTINGELTLSGTQSRTKIEGGTTFTTAHLSGNQAELGFAPGQTLTGTILFESGNSGNRYVGMNGSTGTLAIGAAGVIRTDTGFASNGVIGGSNLLAGGTMTLVNQGLISSQTSGRTVSVVPASFTNQNVVEAINGGLLDISATNWTSAPGATLRALNGSTLTLNGAWSNSGALTVDSSTLNLGGTFTTAGLNLAGFTRTGGTVNVTGTLNNAANTLTLNNATGSWTLSGGTISGGTLATTGGQTLAIANNSANLLTGVTVNGELTLSATQARTKIEGGTTFTTAHLSGNQAELGFAPGSTLTGTILFESGNSGNRYVGMNGSTGTFTIGAAGVIRTETGFASNGVIGGSNLLAGGTMTLVNQGLISSQESGRTITVQPGTFTNSGTVQAMNAGTLNVAAATVFNNYTLATQTLTGGTWIVSSTGTTTTLQLNRTSNILVNAAEISLSGAGSAFLPGTTATTLESTLTTNNGTLRVLGGRSFTNTNALTNAGLLELGGGTLNAPSLANSVLAATLTGFGTVTPRPANSGAIVASGGTLVFSNGIGGSGAGNSITINAAASLSLSAGAQDSTTDFLAHNGTSLALGTRTITVGRDYTNAGFGSGNTFNGRANVTGAGPINAAGTTAQAIVAGTGVNGVTGGTTATPTLTLGNIHEGSSVTLNFRVANTGGAGSADLRGALQGAANGGNITDARLSGTGVTAANFGPLAPGGDSGDKAITLSGTAAGALTGQKVNVANNFDNVGDQLVSLVGAVYRFAAPSALVPEPVVFGIKHVGEPAPTQLLTLTNSAAADGFSESLNASIGGATGGVTTNGGSISLLAPGATNSTSLSVSINTTTRGNKNGTATVSLVSDGAGSSGLGLSTLTAQTVHITGQVNEFAQPTLFFKTGAATLTMESATHFTLDFGIKQQSSGPFGASFGLRNTLLDATFQDALGGAFDVTTVNDFTLGGFVAFSGLAPGAEFDPTITFSTTQPNGIYTDTLFLNPTSSNASGTTNQSAIQLDIVGQVIPEPATAALLLGAAPLLPRRRRRC